MSAAPPPPVARRIPRWSGRLVAGLLLILFGLVWLLEALHLIDLPWDALLPAALVLVGVALVVAARSGRSHGGLIATGVALTGLLVLGSAIDFPVGGGVGEREERPAAVSDLREEYRLGIGRLTVDLTDLPADAIESTERVRAILGIGQLVVVVPQGVPIGVVARAALGNVRLLGMEGSGVEVVRAMEPAAAVEPALELTLSVGLGQVEVRRG